jgi:hypothetical protein
MRFSVIFVTRDLGSGVSEAAESVACGHVKELLAGGEIAIAARHFEAGAAAHVASKDAHPGASLYYKFVAARYHRHA